MAQTVWVKQVKSASKCTEKQIKTLRSIGLRGVNTEALRKDTHALRGMLNKVHHMIEAKLVDPAKLQQTQEKTNRGYTLG